MSFTKFAITMYQKSPFYPNWGRRFGRILVGLRKLAGVPQIQKKQVPCGIMLNIDRDQCIDTKVMHDRFELESIELIKRIVKPGWTCCDVGANIGVLSLLMAKQTGSTGRVYAFEPSLWTYERLKANIEINPYPWIDPQRAAVGTTSQPSMELRVPCGYRLDGKDTSTVQVMPLVALDDFFAEKSDLHFLKIDTDGFESQVLGGAMRTLERLKPVIFFELGPDHLKRAGSSATELTTTLANLGYQFEDESGRSIDPLEEAKKLYPNGSFNVVAQPGRSKA